MANASLLHQALSGIWPPALVSGLVLAAAWRPLRGGRRAERAEAARPTWREALGGPLAIGLGYVACDVGLHGFPPPPPGNGIKDRLVYVALATVLVGAVEAWRRGRAWHVGRVALCVAAPWFLLDFMREHHWEGATEVLWLAGLAAAALALVSGVDVLARRSPGSGGPALGVALVSLAAGALHFGGSASLAQLAGGLATPLGAFAVLAWWRRDASLAGGATTSATTLYLGLVAAGFFAAELPGASAALLALAPLGAWIGRLPALEGRGALRLATAAVAMLAPAALALWLAKDAVPPNPYAGY